MVQARYPRSRFVAEPEPEAAPGPKVAPGFAAKLVIEKGIPLPVRRDASSPYPFEELEVGDSFVEVDGSKTVDLSWRASSVGRRLGRRFVTRAVLHEGRPARRVWRVA